MNSFEAHTKVKPKVKTIRRIVTGHNHENKSVVIADTASPHVMLIHGLETHAVTDLWATNSTPANPNQEDICSSQIQLAPPENGTVFRVVEFPPDSEWLGSVDTQAAFASMGKSGADAINKSGNAKHPFMHITQSVDYAIVISGEIWAVLDEDEVLMRAGDVLIQRATNHAWSNRSSEPCLIAFVLVDAAGNKAP